MMPLFDGSMHRFSPDSPRTVGRTIMLALRFTTLEMSPLSSFHFFTIMFPDIIGRLPIKRGQ